MTEEKDPNIYVVEAVQLSSDSDTEQLLQEVHGLNEMEDSLDNADDLGKLMKSTIKNSTIHDKMQEEQKVSFEPKHVQRLEVVDDFIRNFLMRNKMTKTIDAFQREWYEYVHNSKGDGIPDAHLENEVLKDQIEQLRGQLNNAVILSEKAKATYDQLLKERDFHKMHHQRVQKDKKKLNENIERLSSLQNEYSKKFDELNEKYNSTMKEKMLIKIERDKLKVETAPKKEAVLPVIEKDIKDKSKIKFTPLPQDEPFQGTRTEQISYKQTVLSKTQKGHTLPICCVAFHHKKPIVGTGSDDMVWKIWTVNQSEQIMVGEGHKDWISSIKFHPKGLHIVTGSGDSTVKIWDFNTKTCSFTFSDHRQPIWSIDLNRTGDYIATGSMDHSARLLDINVGKCRSVLRGHVDAVHSVHFQPTTNLLATASADKTLSIWDMRTSLCVQTFYGHEISLNACKFNPKGDRLHSCDANGIVKTWDMKAAKLLQEFSCDKKSANCLSVERNGNILAAGTDQAQIYLFNDASGERETILRGHEEKSRVQAVQFDPNSKMLISGGSDCTYRIWQ